MRCVATCLSRLNRAAAEMGDASCSGWSAALRAVLCSRRKSASLSKLGGAARPSVNAARGREGGVRFAALFAFRRRFPRTLRYPRSVSAERSAALRAPPSLHLQSQPRKILILRTNTRVKRWKRFAFLPLLG